MIRSSAILTAALMSIWASAMASPLIEKLFENVSLEGEGGITEARASAKAHASSSGENLGHHSTRLENQSFIGTYTPPEFPEGLKGGHVYGLAIFSDDGCQLKIDGRTVHQRYKKGQALPNLNKSFYDLPVLLTPGKPVEIELNYSNTYFITRGSFADIDGVTLYLYKVRAGIIPDYNRDGVINDEDRGKVTKANPWRWWVNDDDDSGEINEGKGAGNDIPGNTSPDHADMQVDGMRDLVDFFPIQLDLSEVVERHSPDSHQYLIKHSVGGIKFHEVTDAQPNVHGGAAEFLRGLGAGRLLSNAQLKAASPVGAELNNTMLEAIERGEGLLLLEAATASSEPIEVEILDRDKKSVLTLKFPLLSSPVEAMYRHANMREQVC